MSESRITREGSVLQASRAVMENYVSVITPTRRISAPTSPTTHVLIPCTKFGAADANVLYSLEFLRLSTPDKLVYLILLTFIDRDTSECSPSLDVLADRLGRRLKWTRERLRSLEQADLVRVDGETIMLLTPPSQRVEGQSTMFGTAKPDVLVPCEWWGRIDLNIVTSTEFGRASLGAKVAYMVMGLYINHETQTRKIKQEQLAERCGWTVNHVQKLLKELVGLELIRKRHCYRMTLAGPRQVENSYTLLTPPSRRPAEPTQEDLFPNREDLDEDEQISPPDPVSVCPDESKNEDLEAQKCGGNDRPQQTTKDPSSTNQQKVIGLWLSLPRDKQPKKPGSEFGTLTRASLVSAVALAELQLGEQASDQLISAKLADWHIGEPFGPTLICAARAVIARLDELDLEERNRLRQICQSTWDMGELASRLEPEPTPPPAVIDDTEAFDLPENPIPDALWVGVRPEKPRRNASDREASQSRSAEITITELEDLVEELEHLESPIPDRDELSIRDARGLPNDLRSVVIRFAMRRVTARQAAELADKLRTAPSKSQISEARRFLDRVRPDPDLARRGPEPGNRPRNAPDREAGYSAYPENGGFRPQTQNSTGNRA
jgi:hypothetical protein